MKKQLFILALAAATLVSCDPIQETATFEVTPVSADDLLKDATFAQFNGIKNADGTITYEPCANGNWIQFEIPSVNSVYIYYIKKDGSEGKLSYGRSGGMFQFVPTRGSDPVQTVYFKYVDANLNEVVATKEFTLQVAQELSPENKLLCSNGGSKKWYWKPTSVNGGAVWGNAGYQAGAQSGDGNINGAWWGCGTIDGDCPDTFEGQLQHSAIGKVTGEEYQDSYMEFNEDGSLTKYSPEGTLLGTGTFVINGYKGGEAIDDNGNVAYLETSAGAILWPWAINQNGLEPTKFEVAYLSVDNMVLIYAVPDTGGWDECTWWSFGNYDDAVGMMTSTKWGWYPTEVNGGATWGNAGYQAGAQSDPNTINGAWWGCGPVDGPCGDTFEGQLQHSAIGSLSGQEYMDSYMEFAEDGSLAKYGPDGTKLGEGTWEVDMTPTADWNVGTLKTTAGAILWPWAINTNGQESTEFEVGYMSGSNIILIYAAPDTGGWDECTWWSFGKR